MKRVQVVTLVTLACLLGFTSCQAGSPAMADSRWHWPVPASHSILRGYVAPATDYSAGHRGIDVSASLGADIEAPASGVVTVAEHVVNRDVVSIEVPGGWTVSFDGATGTVPVGARVMSGELVAHVAATPHCEGVHIGVRLHGAYVNPLRLLGNIPRAVLLPW